MEKKWYNISKLIKTKLIKNLKIFNLIKRKKLALYLVNDVYMTNLCKNINYYKITADVLSFPTSHPLYFGYIYINIDKLKDKVNKRDKFFKVKRTLLLIIHSYLHLIGYNHTNTQEENIMRLKEKELLTLLGINKDIDKLY